MIKYSVYFNGELTKSYELDEPVIFVGRLPENNIPISNMGVSRRHVKIELDQYNSYTLTDLNSLNGTLVNGKKVKKVTLCHGDKITIGKHTIIYEDYRPESSAPHLETIVAEFRPEDLRNMAMAGQAHAVNAAQAVPPRLPPQQAAPAQTPVPPISAPITQGRAPKPVAPIPPSPAPKPVAPPPPIAQNPAQQTFAPPPPIAQNPVQQTFAPPPPITQNPAQQVFAPPPPIAQNPAQQTFAPTPPITQNPAQQPFAPTPAPSPQSHAQQTFAPPPAPIPQNPAQQTFAPPQPPVTQNPAQQTFAPPPAPVTQNPAQQTFAPPPAPIAAASAPPNADGSDQTAQNCAVLIETSGHIVYKLDRDATTIGSDEGDDIYAAGVSKGFAVIERYGGEYHLTLQKVMSKIKVNGKNIKTHKLEHRDRIEIGSNTFRFMENG